MSDARVLGPHAAEGARTGLEPYPVTEGVPLDEPDPLERRIAPRRIALESRTSLGWWAGKQFLTFPSRLLDISRAGVALQMPHPPPEDRDVWFRVDPLDDSARIWGEVVSISPSREGRYTVRVAFWSPCPDRIYRAALDGPLRHGA
jgi:PilZ domain